MLVFCSSTDLTCMYVRLVSYRTSGAVETTTHPNSFIKPVTLGRKGWVPWMGGIWQMVQQNRGFSFTLDMLQLLALPIGGSLWAWGHSGQEPTLEPGPHPQDAHTQWPKAVVSQTELNSDSGVNLNQTLPHGGPGKQVLLQWKPADLFMETSQAGEIQRERMEKQLGTKDFC